MPGASAAVSKSQAFSTNNSDDVSTKNDATNKKENDL